MFESASQIFGTAYCLGMVGFVLSYLLTYGLVKWLPRWGLVDRPDYARHIHTRTVPRGGGIAMILAFCTVTLAFCALALRGRLGASSAQLLLRLLAPLAILFPLGLLDDRFGLRPRTKFLFQLLSAFLAWWLGFRLGNVFGLTLPPWLAFVLTLLWIVGFINAFNMIDGVDGLATGVGVISAVCLSVVGFSSGEHVFAAVLVAFAASLLGFLRYNWNPASVFMGDSGSMFIGYVLAVSGLFLNARLTSVASIGIPLLACGIPLLDIFLAVWRRLLSTPRTTPLTADLGGKAAHPEIDTTEKPAEVQGFLRRCLALLARLGEADQRHLHHRLMMHYRKNQRKTVFSIYLLAIGMGAAGILCCFLPGRNLLLALVVILGTFSFIINRVAAVELWRTTELAYQNFQSPQAGVKITYVLNPLADFLVIGLAYYLDALAMRGFQLPPAALCRYVGLVMATLLLTRAYRVFWNFAVSDDYFRLIWKFALGFCVAGASDLLFSPKAPVALHLHAAALAIVAVMLERLGIHYLRNYLVRRTAADTMEGGPKIRTVLLGVTSMARYYRNRLFVNLGEEGREELLGIIAQNRGYLHSNCFGMKVLGLPDDLPAIVRDGHVSKLVVAMPLPESDLRRLRAFCAENKVRLASFDFHEDIIE